MFILCDASVWECAVSRSLSMALKVGVYGTHIILPLYVSHLQYMINN